MSIVARAMNNTIPGVMNLNCPDKMQFINKLTEFGFLYTLNTDINSFSEAHQICEKVHNPMKKHVSHVY